MTERSWELAEPPAGWACWSRTPAGLADLSRVRRELQRHLAAPSGGGLHDDWVQECVLALDELMSNGLRHGRAPVEVTVCTASDGVLLAVSDGAADIPPSPTSTRDPGLGGMGLGLVAATSVACGWAPAGGVKTVWAVMPTSAPAPAAA